MNMGGSLPHHAPPTASMSIQGWIEAVRDTTPNSFAERAVDLAWILTKSLCNIIDNSALGVQLPLEDHIRADNVVIFAPPLLTSNANNSAATIIDAKFKSLIPIEPSLVVGNAQPAASAAPRNFPSSPPAVCVALGKLLLDIFSKFSGSTGLGSEAGSSNADPGRTHEDGESSEPLGKRRATTTSTGFGTSNASSDRAKDILVSSGMPLSLSRLVCDLLDAAVEGGTTPVQAAFSSLSLEDMFEAENDAAHSRNFAIGSVHVAMWDLSQMKAHPTQFLFDRLCPQKALDDTCLFCADVQQLVGREEEMSALTALRDKVSNHVRETGNHFDRLVSSLDGNNFLCEAFFLCGYAGSGKSSLVNSLTRSCAEDHWFVLSCKFTQQSSPHMVLAEAFNGFFGKWGAANNNPNSDLPRAMVRAFNRICTAIFNVNDDEGLRHLCHVVPNFARVFPLIDLRSDSPGDNTSLGDTVGSGRKRMRNLFHVLLKSLCSAGHPGKRSTVNLPRLTTTFSVSSSDPRIQCKTSAIYT